MSFKESGRVLNAAQISEGYLLNATNASREKQFPGLPEKSLTWWQIVLLIIGTILVFLSIVGTFIPE